VYFSPLALTPSLSLQYAGAPSPVPLMAAFVAIGAWGAIGYVAAAFCAPSREARVDVLSRLGDALVLPAAASMLAFGLWSTYRVNPVYDIRLYAFELVLGAPFSAIFLRLFSLMWPLNSIASGCYAALPLGMVLVAAVQPGRARQTTVLTTAIVAGGCGFLLYFLCPAAGTLMAFGAPYPPSLPTTLADASLTIARVGEPRNAMPSLHAVWALLLWFNARSLSILWRRTLRLFAVMNIAAAMGPDGSHWLMDVVVSVPLAVAIQSATVTRTSDRSWHWALDAVACSAMTALWLIGFRLGRPLLDLPFTAAWAATIVTVVWPLRRQRRADVRADSLNEPRRAGRRVAADPATTLARA
jgi:hypothetical protein